MAAEAERTIVEPSGAMRTGAVAAIALIAVLLAGAVSAALGPRGGPAQNWLLVLHGINAGAAGLTLDALKSVRIVDVTALALAAVTLFGARPLVGKSERVWTGIAAALPVAGIAVLLVTGLAGRSALMAAGVLLGWRMTKRDGLRMLGWLAVVWGWLLLVADLSTSATPDTAAADVVALSYVLLVVWLAWLAFRLLRPLRGRLVPVGVHSVTVEGGGCRYGGSDTREVFDLPLSSQAEGTVGKFVGVADEATRFTVEDTAVTLMRFLEAYDAADGVFEVRVEEPGRLAAMTIEKGAARTARPLGAVVESGPRDAPRG